MAMHQFWDASHPHCERGSANVVNAPVEVTVACCLCVRLLSTKYWDKERELREQNFLS